MPKLVRKAESCENCGRDLPEMEICQYCGHDNHQLFLSGRACKRIRKEIEADRPVNVTKTPLWKTDDTLIPPGGSSSTERSVAKPK